MKTIHKDTGAKGAEYGFELDREVNLLVHEPKTGPFIRQKYPLYSQLTSGGKDLAFYLAVLDICVIVCGSKSWWEEERRLRDYTRELVTRMPAQCGILSANSLTCSSQIYAVFYERGDKRSLRRETEQIFLRLKTVLGEQKGVYLTVGVSSLTDRVCLQNLEEARIALERRIAYGCSNLYFYEDEYIFRTKKLPAVRFHMLEKYLEQGQSEKRRKMLHTLFSEDMVKKYGMSYIRILWVRTLSILMQYYEPEIRGAIDADMLLKSYYVLDKMYTMDEIFDYIWNIAAEFQNGRRRSDSRARDKVLLAEEYIKKHYCEEISINLLSERYGMNPNYFSAIFKKEMHHSPVDYITRLRVEKAKEYLKETHLHIREISERVGYEDCHYFFRVFKKITGMTPMQYRQSHTV